MKSVILTLAFIVTSSISINSFAQCDDGEKIIKFSFVTSTQGHPKGAAATLIADRINKEMNGKACMQLYPNSQLFNDNDVMEALLSGEVQMAAPSIAKFEPYTKKFRVFDLPFLFSDMDAVNTFANGPEGKSLLNAMESNGFIGLSYIYNGLKNFSATKPIILPSDAKGLTFRVQTSDVAVAMIKAMEAKPMKLAFKEVYTALKSGKVDGQENTWSNIYTKKFFEVQNSITETNHELLTYLAVTSKKWLNSLPKGERDQFITIVKEETANANKRAQSINEINKHKIILEGGTIHTLTPSQRKQWIKVMKPVWSQFKDDIGKDVFQAILKAEHHL